jgi:hypothetical protein
VNIKRKIDFVFFFIQIQSIKIMLERETPTIQTQESTRRPRRHNRRILRDEYYDTDTSTLLCERLTDDDKNYIRRNNLQQHEFLRDKWNIIVLSLHDNYLEEYYSLRRQTERNQWLKRYLDLETHYIDRMPVTLLPL